MTEEAKLFIYAMEQCRNGEDSGMYWYGDIPKEIVELYDVNTNTARIGQHIAGVYVVAKPRYLAVPKSEILKLNDGDK